MLIDLNKNDVIFMSFNECLYTNILGLNIFQSFSFPDIESE